MEPITNHNKMLTESICRTIFRYLLENPSVPYSEVVRVLANVQYAVGMSLDTWYDQLVEQVGMNITEQCVVPELHNFLEWPLDDTDWDTGIEPNGLSTEDLEFDLDSLGDEDTDSFINEWDPEEDLEDD